jgi:hypothetical protein|tara:strand:- start:26183 stop:26332 length:150 start_codon:yes stop_codon:yes gene_type:complete
VLVNAAARVDRTQREEAADLALAKRHAMEVTLVMAGMAEWRDLSTVGAF